MTDGERRTDRERRRWYYWIVARDPETGKPYLIFGHSDENQARMRGLEMLPGIDFELKRLPTSNLASASSMIHGNRLEQTKSLKQAARRIGHDRSLQRLKEKYRRRRTLGGNL